MQLKCIHIASLVLVALLSACGGDTEAIPAAPVVDETPTEQDASADDGAWNADGDVTKVLTALSTKTPEPRCQDVEKLVANPIDAYRQIIANVTEPGFTPMRAATCLIGAHPRDAEADALIWVADPAKASLTTLVLGRLDTLPLDSAKKIALAALAGPHAEIASVRIGRLRTPELKALAAQNE